ncbi:MAG: HEAT repeat domain-containing protein [Acidimicrobiales bacterium]
MKDPKAVDVLIGLLDDPDVEGHAVVALGNLRAESARDRIEPLLEHPKTWIRQEAKRALAKIDKAAAKRAAESSTHKGDTSRRGKP